MKPFLCLLASSDSVKFVTIELLTDDLVKSSVRLDTSSFGLIGNAYASLCDSANLMFSGSFSVSIGISFPYYSLTYATVKVIRVETENCIMVPIIYGC